jgi:acetyltransferase-like isoleucine patch superfamily enzyme
MILPTTGQAFLGEGLRCRRLGGDSAPVVGQVLLVKKRRHEQGMEHRMRCETDSGTDIAPSAVVGHVYDEACQPAVLGADAVVRDGTIIYGDVIAGDRLQTGHNALIREETELGDDVLVGTNAVIDGYSQLGSNVSLQTGVYVPSYTELGSNVFVGPQATLTNDSYPLRTEVPLKGPVLEDDVSIGANATLLPEIRVGERAFVAAGAVVTEDVPPETLAVGNPAEHRPLPERLEGGNDV